MKEKKEELKHKFKKVSAIDLLLLFYLKHQTMIP